MYIPPALQSDSPGQHFPFDGQLSAVQSWMAPKEWPISIIKFSEC
jgi:hypothetical protein